MNNAVKGETPLVLDDGREFTLVLDHEALLGVEQTYGKPLHKAMADAQEGFLSAVSAIAQAAFTRFHPEVSRGDILKMVMSADRDALTSALGTAAENAFSPPDGKAGNGAASASPQRGKTSGRSGAKRA